MRIKKRKGKTDAGHQICKNCRKDFNENENFSWKCRTHRSDYSVVDDLWWCCLAKGPDTKGCKQSKHEAIPEDEDEDDRANEKN